MCGNLNDPASAPPSERMQQALLRPPSCLADFVTQSATPDITGRRFDGHNSPHNSFFALACPCGGTAFTATAYRHPVQSGYDYYHSPVVVTCLACDRSAIVVDTRRHGYDPVINDMGYNGMDDPEATRQQYPCDECGEIQFELIARFEYFANTVDGYDYFRERKPDLPLHGEQDLFSWVTVIATCIACQHLQVIADLETA